MFKTKYLKKSNYKSELIETNQYLILKSYQKYIAIYYKPLKIMIININGFQYSRITNKHYKIFAGMETINHTIYLKDENFNKLIDRFFNFGDLESQIDNLYKNYSLEKNHIERVLNYNLDDFKQYDLNYCFLGFNTIDQQKQELKTINKNIFLLELPSEIYKPIIKITQTTTKKGKPLKYNIKLVSKFGLSFNNFKPSELREV